MKSRSVIFAVIAVLLVPFIYGSSSIPDACAKPSGGGVWCGGGGGNVPSGMKWSITL